MKYKCQDVNTVAFCGNCKCQIIPIICRVCFHAISCCSYISAARGRGRGGPGGPRGGGGGNMYQNRRR